MTIRERHGRADRRCRSRWTASAPRPTRLLTGKQPDGHWVFELEADATIPAEYVLLRHYLGEPVDAELEAQDRASICAASRARMAAGRCSTTALRHERQREGLFRAEDDRRRHRRATHARAREAILSRGGAANANVFTRALLALYRSAALAQRAGDAGRDHAAAEVVSVPSRQDLVLGAHRDRAAAGAAGAQAARAQSARRDDRRAVPTRIRPTVGTPHKAPHQKWPGSRSSAAIDIAAARDRAAVSRSGCAQARDRQGGRLRRPSASTARTASARSSRRWPTR